MWLEAPTMIKLDKNGLHYVFVDLIPKALCAPSVQGKFFLPAKKLHQELCIDAPYEIWIQDLVDGYEASEDDAYLGNDDELFLSSRLARIAVMESKTPEARALKQDAMDWIDHAMNLAS